MLFKLCPGLTGNGVDSAHAFLFPWVRIVARLVLALARVFTVAVHDLPEIFQTPIICPLIITDCLLLQGFRCL